jgi:hypothetical protein
MHFMFSNHAVLSEYIKFAYKFQYFLTKRTISVINGFFLMIYPFVSLIN